MNLKLVFSAGLLLAALMCAPTLLSAQPGPPGGPGGAPTAVPFDGGLSLVAAAGAGYAIKKARDKYKQGKKQDAATS